MYGAKKFFALLTFLIISIILSNNCIQLATPEEG